MIEVEKDFEGNLWAAINGVNGVTLARLIMAKEYHTTDIEYVDKQYDFIVDDVHIVEVKTCQFWIRDRHNSKKRRHGCFILKQKHHQYLCDNNGMYLFIVYNTNILEWIPLIADYHYKFIPANMVSFKRKWYWKRLFDLHQEAGHVCACKM